MTDFGRKIIPETLRTIDATTFTGSFLPVGLKSVVAARVVQFQNQTDRDVFLSWDGINDNEFLKTGTNLVLDVTSNEVSDVGFFIAKNTQFFVRGDVGTGIFYISIYGAE